MYRKFGKRMCDLICAGLGLLLLSPVYICLIILVRCKLGSPVFFHQDRPGKDEKVFRLYKFRTMTDEKDDQGNLLPDSVRLTSFGKLLRKTSLDELPELWNIFRGDMSIIGPRPLLVSYLPYYTERERLRHTVRPGLTGLAQASGRNFLDWDHRFAKDVEYVEHLSLAMDVKVVFLTLKIIFVKENVAEDTNQAEGNFAKIRQERMEKEGFLMSPEMEKELYS